ncbi:19754_t:CDS:2 [Gigaspora margarita]|uniref:19754_t:CDS:1 n=1 Tax=Gigaspora margarita TaxID=4874 RepID=A0ABN7VB30_GIGMA|nr:19754_t:CDS:2 [Gigaspora margarita]
MTRSLTETEDIHNLIFGKDREAIVKARLELARDLITEEKEDLWRLTCTRKNIKKDKELQTKKNEKETLRQEIRKPESIERKWK